MIASTLAHLLETDDPGGLPRADPERWLEFVEHVAETLDIGPGTSVFDAGCGSGAFLYPLSVNGYRVGGLDPSAAAVASATGAMPAAPFTVASVASLDPAEPWQVVVASHGFSGCQSADDARALLARMAAKATHAIAVLGVEEGGPLQIERSHLLRWLAEVGASAVHFESTAEGRLHVFARVP